MMNLQGRKNIFLNLYDHGISNTKFSLGINLQRNIDWLKNEHGLSKQPVN